MNVYIGHALKVGDAPMTPTEAPEVQKDPEQLPENREPTPWLKPEDPIEPDTEKELNKKDEDDDDDN